MYYSYLDGVFSSCKLIIPGVFGLYFPEKWGQIRNRRMPKRCTSTCPERGLCAMRTCRAGMGKLIGRIMQMKRCSWHLETCIWKHLRFFLCVRGMLVYVWNIQVRISVMPISISHTHTHTHTHTSMAHTPSHMIRGLETHDMLPYGTKYTDLHSQTYICIIHTYIHVYVRVCMYIRMYVCVYVSHIFIYHTYVCIHLCVYVCIYICVY